MPVAMARHQLAPVAESFKAMRTGVGRRWRERRRKRKARTVALKRIVREEEGGGRARRIKHFKNKDTRDEIDKRKIIIGGKGRLGWKE